jgi:hypothetical protein
MEINTMKRCNYCHSTMFVNECYRVGAYGDVSSMPLCPAHFVDRLDTALAAWFTDKSEALAYAVSINLLRSIDESL